MKERIYIDEDLCLLAKGILETLYKDSFFESVNAELDAFTDILRYAELKNEEGSLRPLDVKDLLVVMLVCNSLACQTKPHLKDFNRND